MKTISTAVAAAALMTVGAQAVFAEAGGYTCTTVATGSDALISVPYTSDCDASLTVNAVVGGSGVTVNETLTAGEYDGGLFYVRFTSGAADGKWSTVTSNTAGELVFSDTSILTGVANGDSLKVFAHQTLETVFSDNLENLSFFASDSTFFRNGTEVLVPSTTPGTNQGASAIYYYYKGQWRDANVFGGGDADDVILAPQSVVTVRNTSTTDALSVYTQGDVVSGAQVLSIPVESVDNDVEAGTGQAVPLSLGELGLGGGSAFVSSSGVGAVDGDELLVYDNVASGINKQPSATYYYTGGNWHDKSDDSNANGVVLSKGSVLVIRKVSGAVGTVSWKQSAQF